MQACFGGENTMFCWTFGGVMPPGILSRFVQEKNSVQVSGN
jgi:hypothetical protein